MAHILAVLSEPRTNICANKDKNSTLIINNAGHHITKWQFCFISDNHLRGHLPVIGYIHYGDTGDFSYSPLEVSVYSSHYITFVLQRGGKAINSTLAMF